MTITAIKIFLEEREIFENSGILLVRSVKEMMGKYVKATQMLNYAASLKTIVRISDAALLYSTIQIEEFVYYFGKIKLEQFFDVFEYSDNERIYKLMFMVVQ